MCMIVSLNLISVHSTLVTARNLFTQTFPRPFGEKRDGFSRTECVSCLILTSSEYSASHQVPAFGRIKSVIGRHYSAADNPNPGNAEWSHHVAAMNEALSKSGLSARDISYLELHGPATVEGDLEEFRALRDVFDSSRSGLPTPIYVGTMTATVGNTEVAYGVVGIVKVLLTLTKETVTGFMCPENIYAFDSSCDVTTLANVSMPTQTAKVDLGILRGNAVNIYGSVHGFGINGYAGHLVLEVDRDTCDTWGRLLELHCTDPMYVIHPTIEVLRSLTPSQLTEVSGFSVSFPNGHHIEWTDPVDLSRVGDIASVINYSSQSVEVFPEGVEKHRPGDGLNRPAVITLADVSIDEKKSGEEMEELFRRRLKKLGADLLWFDGAKKSVCFRVKQF